MNGYMGKIIRIDLTNHNITYIDTSDYEQWGGGHGIGSALFFDIAVVEKGLHLENMDHNSPDDGGFHPDNVVTIMTSPFTGTSVPGASARTEVQGIGVQSYPIGWFTRSNFGGRFGPMLKYAGYDGIVIEGASQTPIWIDIRDDSIEIRDCGSLNLWGMDTKTCQETIWDFVAGNGEYGKWISPDDANGETTQKPAVLTIGPAGENKSRMACLIHGASNASGQGGFGGVWGSKNLKAISVIGTGSIEVSDPVGLMRARQYQVNTYGFNLRDLNIMQGVPPRFYAPPVAAELYRDSPLFQRLEGKRPQGCVGCPSACRARYSSGKANEASCQTTHFYSDANSFKIMFEAIDLLNRYGFNAFDLVAGLLYLKDLHSIGVLGGPGSEIETELDFDDYGSLNFVNNFLETIAKRGTEFGDTVAEGFQRAIEMWGRMDDIDYTSEGLGKIELPYWGLPEHAYHSPCQVEYGYGTILSDRDVNEHCFSNLCMDGALIDGQMHLLPGNTILSAEKAVSILSEKMIPHKDDYSSVEERKQMLNYNDDNMYSEDIARLVSWHRHYTRFFKQSLLFCDLLWPDIININTEDKTGSTGKAEPEFIKAVTGKDLTFLDGMKLGKKIWNLDNAIWVLQGRHRDMVHFADYVYSKDSRGLLGDGKYFLPTYDANCSQPWKYRNVACRHIEKGVHTEGNDLTDDFESFKTRFYNQEGWDPTTGWPTRSTLEETGIDLSFVADILEEKGRLGAEDS